jgi:protein disulfide-isomerase A6
VNADDDKGLLSQYNVGGFPTIKIIYGSKVEDYNGPRTAKGVVDAALKAAKAKVEATLDGKSSGGGGGSSSSSGGSGGNEYLLPFLYALC